MDAGIARQKALGHFGPEAHPASRPNQVEARRWSSFWPWPAAPGPRPMVHLSTRQGLEAIRSRPPGGQVVWAETCPSTWPSPMRVYRRPGFEGAKFVCSPPIRSQADQDACGRPWRG